MIRTRLTDPDNAKALLLSIRFNISTTLATLEPQGMDWHVLAREGEGRDKRLTMACPVMFVLPWAAYLHMCEKLWQMLTTNDHRNNQLHNIQHSLIKPCMHHLISCRCWCQPQTANK